MASNYELGSSEPLQRQLFPSPAKISTWNSLKHHIPHIIITILVDIIIPLLIYFALENRIRPVFSLLAASSPPFFMVIFRAVLVHSFDAIGFLCFIAFVISAILGLALNSPIILLLEKSLITGIGAVVFALTLIPFRCCSNRCRWRPMVYYFYYDLIPISRAEFGLPDNVFDNDQYTELKDDTKKRDLPSAKEVAQLYAWIYDHCPSFRTVCYFMTSVWAIAFSIEFITRVILISLHFSINTIYICGQIVFCVLVILCAILQISCMAIERKYTLAYIEQWKMENLNVQQSHPNSFSTPHLQDNGTIVQDYDSTN